MLRINNIKLKLDEKESKLLPKAARVLRVDKSRIRSFHIVKRAVDARDKRDIRLVYTVDVQIDQGGNEAQFLHLKNVVQAVDKPYYVEKLSKAPGSRPVVVGSGPAGLFAALVLAEAGACPVIIERGADVVKRKLDVEKFWREGSLSEDSNVQFGEGGAGTFSDGKLTTGIKDYRVKKVIDEFVQAGAPEEIAYESKPHIGSDKLVSTLLNLRMKIASLGGEFRFANKVNKLIIEDNRVVGVEIIDLNTHMVYSIQTDHCVFAVGHSARDTFEMLYHCGIQIQAKPFSVGVRIEHPQCFIDQCQYGEFAGNERLGPADYKLSAHLNNGKGAYTFCMCPGGQVVAAASEQKSVVTNGMSNYKRDGQNANSALLISIEPKDFGGLENPLAGIAFQRRLEQTAYVQGGENYFAPVQTVGDFLADKATVKFQDVTPSYTPGVACVDLRSCLPAFICESLKEALWAMDKKIDGFAAPGAVLTAAETRSSSPIRILRDERYCSNIIGMHPCGEGAGYAGGIVSAAVDGIKCAEAVLEHIGMQKI